MRVPLLFLAVLVAGCASGPRIDTSYTAAGQDSRAQFLVIHYTHQDFPLSLIHI